MDLIQILIISDDPLSGLGLKEIFSQTGKFTILGCYNFKEAIEESISCQPDVLLLDIPKDIDNLCTYIQKIRDRCTYSLLFAIVGNEHQKIMMGLLARGVDGLLLRGMMKAYMVKVVELGCRAGIFCLPDVIKDTFIKGITKPEISLNNEGSNALLLISEKEEMSEEYHEELTKRELEILQLMSQNCSNRDISKALYIGETTVKTHVSNILRKLGQKNRMNAILFACKIGLVKNYRWVN